MSGFFSILILKGKVSRVPYGLVAVPILLVSQFSKVILNYATLIFQQLGGTLHDLSGLGIFFFLINLLIVPLFIVSFNRLHDIGLTGWLALPYLISKAIPLYVSWTRTNSVEVSTDVQHWITYISMGTYFYGLALALILLLVPSRVAPSSPVPAMV